MQTPAAVATLSEIMHDPKVKPEVRVLASNSLLDRGWGRPHQSVDLEATFSKKLTELTLEEARAFARTLDAALAPTPVLIEGTVEGTSKPELP